MQLIRRPSFILTSIILIFLVIVLSACLEYSFQTAIFPLIPITGGLILAALLMVQEIVPALNGKIEARLDAGSKEAEAGEGQKADLEEERKNLVIMGLWIIAFFALTLLFGFLVSVFVSNFLFLKIGRKVSWLRSLAASLAVWIIVFVVFEKLMHFRLFQGILFGGVVS